VRWSLAVALERKKNSFIIDVKSKEKAKKKKRKELRITFMTSCAQNQNEMNLNDVRSWGEKNRKKSGS
jgi:hypothetical protein